MQPQKIYRHASSWRTANVFFWSLVLHVGLLTIIAFGLHNRIKESSQTVTLSLSAPQVPQEKPLPIVADFSQHSPVIALGKRSVSEAIITPSIPSATGQGSLPEPEFPAYVEINGKQVNMEANAVGTFPRVSVPAKAVIPIHLIAASNEDVQVQVLDGGVVGHKLSSEVLQSDENGGVGFSYQVAKLPGSYRVAVTYQGRRNIFDFWVGPSLPGRVSRMIQ